MIKILKKLKKAGFPFKEHDDDYLNKINGGLGYYATLEELINECQKSLTGSMDNITIAIYKDRTYISIGPRLCMQRFPKTFEGVAELYLELHRKK